MAHKDGTKSGGRVAGQPNRKTQALIDKCDEAGIDIFEEMLRCLQEEREPKERFNMCKEIAQYIYAKRKAVEISSEDDKGFEIVIRDYTKK